jgi:hypothetical protein
MGYDAECSALEKSIFEKRSSISEIFECISSRVILQFVFEIKRRLLFGLLLFEN